MIHPSAMKVKFKYFYKSFFWSEPYHMSNEGFDPRFVIRAVKSFFDADAMAKRLPSVFYRVVSPESAALSGAAAGSSGTGTNTDAVSPKQSK